MTIKAVAFDMGGVLTKCPLVLLKAYEEELQLPAGVTFDLIFNNKELRLALAECQEGRMIGSELESLLINALYEKYPDKKGCKYQPITTIFESVSKDMLNESMLKTVSFLKNRGFKTAMLTNNVFVNEQRTVASDAFFAFFAMDKFDVVIESCKVGICKPKKEIFELLLKELGVAPTECVFIDDFPSNLVEAKKMGIQCIHMKDTTATLEQLEGALQLSSGTLTGL